MFCAGRSLLYRLRRLRISQYGHTAWRNRDGFFTGSVIDVTQTRDGYLWFATATQLIRFDGMRFESWDPPGGPLPKAIVGIFGSSDGSLWIGCAVGLYRWHAGTLTRVADSGRFEPFAEDATGTVWMGNTRLTMPIGPLCRFSRETFWCVGRGDTIPLKSVSSLHVDPAGAVWAGGDKSACRFEHGKADCFEIPVQANGNASWVAASDSQGILAAERQFGVWRITADRWVPIRSSAIDGDRADAMRRDRHGSLWIGTSHSGLVRMTPDGVESFTSADGLSSDEVLALYEDVEDNLRVVTSSGVDRFRDVAVRTITKREGLLEDNVMSTTPHPGAAATHRVRPQDVLYLRRARIYRLPVLRRRQRPPRAASANTHAASFRSRETQTRSTKEESDEIECECGARSWCVG